MNREAYFTLEALRREIQNFVTTSSSLQLPECLSHLHLKSPPQLVSLQITLFLGNNPS